MSPVAQTAPHHYNIVSIPKGAIMRDSKMNKYNEEDTSFNSKRCDYEAMSAVLTI